VSEFYALSYQAILALTEGSEFAGDYLEMAAAAASSPYELAIVAEGWTTHDLRQDRPRAAIERCLATLDHIAENERLCRDLLVAVCRLGDIETIEATLRSLTCGHSTRLPARAAPQRAPEYS
jgi:hypothetical protein